MMADYKIKLAQMWKDEVPTMEELLDVVADFCDDLGSSPQLRPDIYDTAGKIFACVGMVTEQQNATIERLRTELEAEQARTICAMCGEELTRMAGKP